MRADDVELDEEEREPVDGDELEEGRDVDNEEEDEEEGMGFDWFEISELRASWMLFFVLFYFPVFFIRMLISSVAVLGLLEH